jgi:thiamine-phosphate pyrophosphorylase
VIIDPQATNSRDLVQIAASVISGGVSVLQYRDKQSDRSEFLENADALKQICDSANVAFVVNDAADIAKLVGSPFLHVGQSDLDVNSAREILAPFQCIGRSNNGLLEANESGSEGADYLAVGAVYSTNTMGKSNRRPVGPETLSDVKENTELPVVAIGGIDSSNLSEVQASGVDSACVVGAITFADDPEKATKHLVDLWGKR